MDKTIKTLTGKSRDLAGLLEKSSLNLREFVRDPESLILATTELSCGIQDLRLSIQDQMTELPDGRQLYTPQFEALNKWLSDNRRSLKEFSFSNSFEIEGGVITSVRIMDSWMSKIDAISELKNISNLYFRTTHIDDIEPITSLADLEILSLIVNQNLDISSISKLGKLKQLRIGGGHIRDIRPLETLTNLESLTLVGNLIEDISTLAKLRKLHTLDLSSNNFSDISILSLLSNLTTLTLKSLRIKDYTPLLTLKNLKSLEITFSPMSNESYDVVLKLKERGVKIYD